MIAFQVIFRKHTHTKGFAYCKLAQKTKVKNRRQEEEYSLNHKNMKTRQPYYQKLAQQNEEN